MIKGREEKEAEIKYWISECFLLSDSESRNEQGL